MRVESTPLSASYRLMLGLIFLSCLGLGLPCRAPGQSSDVSRVEEAATTPESTFFPRSSTSRWWISGQDNIIFQAHPSFFAAYTGPNSFRKVEESATSNVATLYLGARLFKNTEVFADVESAAGGGLSDALGLAGFVNLDVVRNPTLGAAPYLARAFIRQIIPLSHKTARTEPDPFNLATSVPVRRLEIRWGKFGTADYFDVNDVGSDSHYQFLNWTVANNGAYDYAADTRGYTVGVLVEYSDSYWAVRFAECLMPMVANGTDLEFDLRKARAENVEVELHPKLPWLRRPVLKVLAYVNHANMGVYRDAVSNYLDGRTRTPEITAHPFRTTVKYGLEGNFEQALPYDLRMFARFGWNEGQHQSFAYTEVDSTVQVGIDMAGPHWHRPGDRWGVAFVSNGISADHQQYLRLGGLGFLLGDGGLTYGRETIEEAYYNAHLWRGLFAGPDLQHLNNPGYNQGRGPVLVPGFRIHLAF